MPFDMPRRDLVRVRHRRTDIVVVTPYETYLAECGDRFANWLLQDSVAALQPTETSADRAAATHFPWENTP